MKYAFPCIFLLVVGLSASARAQRNQSACEKSCSDIWNLKYQACAGVEECRRFCVSSFVRCVDECGKNKKK